MREFSKISEDYEVSAADRSAVFKSAWFMLKEEHTELVKELIELIKKEGKISKKLRVYTTGILLMHRIYLIYLTVIICR